MNTDELRFLHGGVLPCRSFAMPSRVLLLDSFNNEFFKDGRIYCWAGSGHENMYLVVFSERSLALERRTEVRGTSVNYVDETRLLFSCEDRKAVLVDAKSLAVVSQDVVTPNVLMIRFKADKNSLFYVAVGSYGLVRWPLMEKMWEVMAEGLVIKSYVIHDDFLYCVYTQGVQKRNLRTGELVWQKSAQESWRSHQIFQSPRFGKILWIRTEQTGISGNTLVVCFDPKIIAGIDINTGDLQWVIDTIGPHKLRVTHEGIGWYIKNDAIQRLDIQKGELLPPTPVQFGTTLEKTGSARIGGFDMSTTHIIAESTVETKSGKSGYIIGINRESGNVDWAVPIEGMVTKLFLLNNRVYATGMMISVDNPKPTAKTLVIEGDGGYIPD